MMKENNFSKDAELLNTMILLYYRSANNSLCIRLFISLCFTLENLYMSFSFLFSFISVFSKLPVKDAKTNCKSKREISCLACCRVSIDAH